MTRQSVVGLGLLLLPALVGCAVFERARSSWWELERGPSGQAPDPATTPEAVVQIYAARAVSWRGIFAVHTWIATKRGRAPAYTRYEVIGWGVDRGWPAIRVNRTGPDNYWFGDRPQKLVDLRGAGVDQVIAKIDAAVAAAAQTTKRKRARALLQKAVKTASKIAHKLRSHGAKKIVPPDALPALQNAADALKRDLVALRRSL
jgi:hypothetical protein